VSSDGLCTDFGGIHPIAMSSDAYMSPLIIRLHKVVARLELSHGHLTISSIHALVGTSADCVISLIVTSLPLESCEASLWSYQSSSNTCVLPSSIRVRPEKPLLSSKLSHRHGRIWFQFLKAGMLGLSVVV
jgi:hypothetical protein